MCQRSISPLITKVHQVQAINSLIDANKTFNALSGFSYIAKFFNLQSLSADLLKQKGKQFCATSWDQLQKTYPNNPFLYTYCINSAYFSRLLSRGYQFPSNATIIPTHTNRDGSNISWTRRKRRYLGRYFAHPMMQNRRAKRDDYKPSAVRVTQRYVP
ncbi:head-tail adaptor protein [Piscirickettsia salmonis]|nr:head-tail adaptor protein [Piscirickettsia salmonis]QHS30497.1 head-tail adaptor protein [Piscirickettsia salmonis]